MKKSVRDRPDVSSYNSERPTVTSHNDSLFSSGDNYLVKNKFNQWELYIEGDPLERGLVYGALMDSLLYKQEHAFFDLITEFVPSEKKQKRLRKFVQWYNRKLYKHVPQEFKAEIYGLSKYVPEDNNYIAPPYVRSLYLHAAHDIGHALQDLTLVECTSTALWGDETEDGELLIGRNLDFYAGDKFAEEKVVLFMNPDKGIPFVSVTWPGMLGIVSGMNKEGLTITMNAGKSKIPLTAKKPISILARQILQYCSTTDEAIALAESSEVFVSESLMIGSAKEKKAILIDMSPHKTGIYEVENSRLVSSNHFQSETFENDRRNKKTIRESHTMYRFNRMNQLLNDTLAVTPPIMADILRNKKGLNNVDLGYGNEKAINQLLAHHGVVFKPEEKQIWVSTGPYNLGAFTAYDLDDIFDSTRTTRYDPQYIDSLIIPKDPFLETQAYQDYEKYRKVDRVVEKAIEEENKSFDLSILPSYIALNPEIWSVHYNAGLLYYQAEEYKKAQHAFQTALQKEVTTLPDCENINKALRKTNRKL